MTELNLFFEDLVGYLRVHGVVCAITSGLACVHYRIAETTKDCDLLCHSSSFDLLLKLLAETEVEGAQCRYRGNISPPLDARWHRGGWTSHFEWPAAPNTVKLDVFGRALRESSPWTSDIFGLYAGPHTVAQMKRTNRDKDWPFITALGVRMIEAEDDRGWLHIFNADTLLELLGDFSCPTEIAEQRPALEMALSGDERVAGAMNAERRLWEELDRRRIRFLEQPLRGYVSAVRRARAARELPLYEDHKIRVECAKRHLPENPLKEYGIDKYIDEARRHLVQSGLVTETALTWLPDARVYFQWLER